MKKLNLSLFAAITLTLVIITALLSNANAPQKDIEKVALLPELADRINDIAYIKINQGDDEPVVIEKKQNQWLISSAYDYPAKIEQIKKTAIALSQCMILAKKTDNPARYEALDVQNPDATNNTKLLTLSNATGDILAEIIIGKPKQNIAGNPAHPSFYARKPNAKHALLIEGALYAPTTNNGWYERKLLDISNNRIKNIKISKNNALLELSKSDVGDTEFQVAQGKTETSSVSLNRVGSFLENLQINSIQKADDFASLEQVYSIIFETFTGLIITVKTAMQEEKFFTQFSFEASSTSATEDKSPNDDAQNLNASLSNWIYEIPDFKYSMLDIDIQTSN
ncbi:hypothetical protein SPBRAN_1509 [uncultured Candidatus Thioglobus sp.]|nr:hypothetical protein SPBRAN_1509 [uncultured Candidatus Thioglobus sp.]